MERVCAHLNTENDHHGKSSSTSLVRLSKMMMEGRSRSPSFLASEKAQKILSLTCQILAQSIKTGGVVSDDAAVDAIKSSAVFARQLDSSWPDENFSRVAINCFAPLAESFRYMKWKQDVLPHQLSGLHWAFESFGVVIGDSCDAFTIPSPILEAYRNLNLPFRIRPGLLRPTDLPDNNRLTLQNLVEQVHFQSDDVTTSTGKKVKERRKTAWQAEHEDILGFSYSGKIMETSLFSPCVRSVRDSLSRKTSKTYDCCLLNLYPDGDSGMRYHIDPDQGRLWTTDTAVVSVGSSRRFSFREISASEGKHPHNFVVMDGDVTEMFGDCQERFQHCVKTVDGSSKKSRREEHVHHDFFVGTDARASLVFKKSLS